ncbi:MAG: hypothetical protein EAZ85_00265 [Bacteroidetes bacterium]|nr:MAG: hypothetical protein EAZ85_00265 [Bacteroidota bacterium]TAG85880.1 MAG: hypothetical protein EAZ20_14005 [Bacteroidota bacterium]
MDELFKELLPFFPSKYHAYHLSLEDNICHFSTLHWGYYLLTFLVVTPVLFLLIYWESAYKYANPFTHKPIKKISLKTNITTFLVCALVGLMMTSIPFILYSDDVTKVSIDGNKKEIRIYGIFSTETIPFAKINQISSEIITEKDYKKSFLGENGTTIKIITDASPSYVLVYRLYGKLDGTQAGSKAAALKEIFKINESLNKYLQKAKQP